MTLQHTHRQGTLILRPAGRLDAKTAQEFRHAAAALLGDDTRRVVLDLSQLSHASAAGQRVVLWLGQHVRSQNGTLVLAGLKGSVREAFEMTGLHALYPLAASVDDAMSLV